MNRNSIADAMRNRVEYLAQVPDWYWKAGLHDAKILSLTEVKLEPDYKERYPRFNCLDIELDCKQALNERNIKKIKLYNYKIKNAEIAINDIDGYYWYDDTIRQLDNKKYLLDIEIDAGRISKHLIVEFEIGEVER